MAVCSTAQILITVPQMLEIMLLSPASQAWVQSLEYVIADEVHSIVEASTGMVWERILTLLPCPVIALSATIGNAGTLTRWLQRVQARRGHSVRLVEHTQRWSDLRMWAYVPPVPRVEAGQSYEPGDLEWCLGSSGSRAQRRQGLQPVHPVGLFATETGATLAAACACCRFVCDRDRCNSGIAAACASCRVVCDRNRCNSVIVADYSAGIVGVAVRAHVWSGSNGRCMRRIINQQIK